MGRNHAIKAFEPHKAGQPLDLLASTDCRAPVVSELLTSPWIHRASELVSAVSGLGGKRREREVVVAWDGERRMPVSFTLEGRRYRVESLVQTWTVERAWWDPRARMSRRCFRVLTRDGLYDLAYDRLNGRWLLIGIVD